MERLPDEPWARMGLFGAASSATEIGAGSFLHALHVPLGGHFLANLQGVVLTGFLNRRTERRRHVFFVSVISGALKSLSPAGRRFRPMLAIFVQGTLFHASVNLLGTGALGVAVGQSLIGAWCSFQPYFFQYLLFGPDLIKSYERFFELAGRYTPFAVGSPQALLGFWIGLHAALSFAVGLAAYYGLVGRSWIPEPGAVEPTGEIRARSPAEGGAAEPKPGGGQAEPSLRWHEVQPWSESVLQAVSELRRTSFIFPFLFVLGFAWLGRSQWDDMAFLGLRAVLVAFVCYVLVKRIDFPAAARWMQARGWAGPARALETAMAELPRRINLWRPPRP